MTTVKTPPKFPYAGYEPSERDFFGVNPQTVLMLFRQGLNTQEIARKLHNASEAEVYNCLASVRQPRGAR